MKPSPLTKTIDLGNVNSFAVLSDLHLRSPMEPNAKLAVQLVRSLSHVEVVVLLGDIFDFIFARSPFFQKHWIEFLEACQYLQSQKTRVVFVEGNHDFGFEHCFPKKLEAAFSVHGDCSVRLTHPKLGNITLRHGDDIVCPDGYLEFRQTVKNKTFQCVAGLVPGVVMHQIFSQWAKISRSHDAYRRLSPEFFTRCIQQRVATCSNKPDLIILGHVHENIDTTIQKIRCISGPSWLDSPNVLLCDQNGGLTRKFPTGKDVPLFPVPKTE